MGLVLMDGVMLSKSLIQFSVQWSCVPSLLFESECEVAFRLCDPMDSSTLAWKIPWTEEPGRLQSMGLQRVRHD